jgi:hypothetical protein
MRMRRYTLLLVEIPFALFLLFDSLMVNGLKIADPNTGTERGCYTIIEDILGAKHEGKIRSLELITGVVLIPLTIILVAVSRTLTAKREQ